MKTNKQIKIFQPKPYEVVGTKFNVYGKIPKDWLSYGRYGLGVCWMDINGNDLPIGGPTADILPEPLLKFRKKIKFYSCVDLSYFVTSEHPRGLILEISGDKSHYFLLFPVIIDGTNKIYKSEYRNLKEKLSNTIKKITKRKEDWKNYTNELEKIRKNLVQNNEILEDIFEILDKSEETFEPLTESEEDKQEKALEEKYREVIEWRGPLLRGLVGRMDGFDFRVHSSDHRQQHFHVIHKSRGIDARFSFPQIKLINYKGHSNTMGRKESKKIHEYFCVAENLEKLTNEFQKQIS